MVASTLDADRSDGSTASNGIAPLPSPESEVVKQCLKPSEMELIVDLELEEVRSLEAPNGRTDCGYDDSTDNVLGVSVQPRDDLATYEEMLTHIEDARSVAEAYIDSNPVGTFTDNATGVAFREIGQNAFALRAVLGSTRASDGSGPRGYNYSLKVHVLRKGYRCFAVSNGSTADPANLSPLEVALEKAAFRFCGY